MKKAGFQNHLEIKHIGGINFQLLTTLVFYSERYDHYFEAPAGITTDFASIPRPLQSIVQVLGNNIRSAVLHDFHCTEEGKAANYVSQEMADNLFKEGLSVDNVRTSKARVMFAGVAIFQRAKYFFKRGETYAGN